jgi:beta-D-galactosyl-(1->4)-L-rhamnose phosphorylase
MPGEVGCEDRVLELARLWGADALRDSDGTELPEKIKGAGYPIYSTVCLIRGDNQFAKANRDKLQQILLISKPVTAEGENEGETVVIELLDSFPREVYEVDASPESRRHWQAFDRTAQQELPREQWQFSPEGGTVEISGAKRWHRYTITFLCYERWEGINRYNHRVNNWTSEPEMPLNPAHPEVREQMKSNLKAWLERNAHTEVVRFTTFYYGNGRGGWGDYGRTVSTRMLDDFEKEYGYCPAAETFVNAGVYNPTHRVPSKEYRDWMAFVHDFFMRTIKVFIDMVHASGKQAFFLLGDHWVGSEPLGERFAELGMDGVVKAVFSGYEVRIAGATDSVPLKEIRFHPYFFPREVTGKPTFCAEGTPTEDLETYWIDIRRACLRTRINRIGFGGYVSLLEKFPDFVDYVAVVSRQAREISALHAESKPYTAPVNVAVLNSWGRSRAWMCSGHMQHNSVYNQFLESLSGLPVNVEFISLSEVAGSGIPEHINVIVNCGRQGTAWSGAEAWRDPGLVEKISEFVSRGGGLLGISEPSALEGGDCCFRLAPVLGIDRESLLCETNVDYDGHLEEDHFISRDNRGSLEFVSNVSNLKLKSEPARIVNCLPTGNCDYFYEYLQPQVVVNHFGAGRSVYLSGFKYNPDNTRTLARALFWAAGQEAAFDNWRCENPHTECAYFPGAGKLLVVNNSRDAQNTVIHTPGGKPMDCALEPLATITLSVSVPADHPGR